MRAVVASSTFPVVRRRLCRRLGQICDRGGRGWVDVGRFRADLARLLAEGRCAARVGTLGLSVMRGARR
jgi:hypothetical protein